MTTTHATPPVATTRVDEGSGGGWLVFAAVMLGVAGIMRIFDAIWAWAYNGPIPENLQDAVFGHDLDTYGWIYIAVAAVLILSALGVLQGSQLSRWIGIVAGSVGIISAMWWMPYYPVWSLTYVALGAMVIYALARYGGSGVAFDE